MLTQTLICVCGGGGGFFSLGIICTTVSGKRRVKEGKKAMKPIRDLPGVKSPNAHWAAERMDALRYNAYIQCGRFQRFSTVDSTREGKTHAAGRLNVQTAHCKKVWEDDLARFHFGGDCFHQISLVKDWAPHLSAQSWQMQQVDGHGSVRGTHVEKQHIALLERRDQADCGECVWRGCHVS